MAPGDISPSTPLWEYHAESFARQGIDIDDVMAQINTLGSYGWELVSAFDVASQMIHFVFKREASRATPVKTSDIL
jgi:hypothetical protein